MAYSRCDVVLTITFLQRAREHRPHMGLNPIIEENSNDPLYGSMRGEKISPYEVEKALLLHPSVKEAAAFSVPHPRLGENVAAAVVLKPESNPPTQDIKTFLADHLAAFKVPQHVLVVPQLPTGATGKVSRSELSEAMVHRTRHLAPAESPLEFQLRDIWQRLLHRDDIGIDDDFFELGGDSLLAVEMILEVEPIARRKIPVSALKAVYTIRQLANTIINTSAITSEALVSCVKRGVGAPFFFFHGEFPRGLWALRLVDNLRCDRPVFLADPDPELTIEEMARCYLPHLLAAQARGAFCLGGYGNGGLVAWELAHQLESLGRQIDFVVVIETGSFNARLPFRMFARLTRPIAAIASGKITQKFKLDIRAFFGGMKRPVYDGPYLRGILTYLLPKLRCDVIAVVCDESRKFKELNTIRWRNLARKVHRKYKYSTRPWNHLARKVHNRYVAGMHDSSPTTYVGQLALLLDNLLSG